MIIYLSNGTPFFNVEVDDDSYRFRELMGANELVLKFSLTEHIEIPVGSYCIYPQQAGGTKYTIQKPESVIIQHRRGFEYTVTLEGVQRSLRKFKLYNPVDGRLKFDYTAQPQEHLQLVIDNLNNRYGSGAWAIGGSISGIEKLISYNHNNLDEVIRAIAETFETEYEITTVSGVNYITLGKVEHNASSPLPLSYGKGNGFISGVSRNNYDDALPIKKLYIQGGERNIDYSKYPDDDADGQHSSTLLLPRDFSFSFDGSRFEGEDGFDESRAIDMETDSYGYSVKLADAEDDASEDSLDVSDIYPSRVGRVTQLLFWNRETKQYVQKSAITDWSKIEFDIVDSTIPNDLDYSSCLMGGETMTLVFQSGMLVSREFQVKYYHQSVSGKAAKRFEIVRETFDGQEMPSENFLPVAGNGSTTGDQYAVFGIMLPQSYFISRTTVSGHYVYSGASYDALREAARYLFKNRGAKYTFKGEMDPIYAKRNWANISDKLVVGGYIRFTDASVVGEEAYYDLRIASVKDYINNPHAPIIELTDEEVYSVGGGLSSELRDLGGESAHTETRIKSANAYTRRSFRDAKETSNMLERAFGSAWGSSSNPVTLHTMQLLAGSEDLQIKFWQNPNCTGLISTPVSVNIGTMALDAVAGYVQHLTLDVPDEHVLTVGKTYEDYHRWQLQAHSFSFANLDPELAYYLYVQCDGTGEVEDVLTGEYILSAAPLDFHGDDVYNFMVGILGSEIDGGRSYVSVYGFTEILPNQITTELIRSSDGNCYFDLAAGKFRIGNSNNSLAWNTDGNGNLVLKGGLVQTGSGATTKIGAWCGEFSSTRVYALGDEVAVTTSSEVVTYRYINSVAGAGHPVSDSNYWEISAKGKDGQGGESIEVQWSIDGSTSWHSTYQSGDQYMRQRIGEGSWSSAIKVVGEEGDTIYKSFVFKASESQPATPSGTSPVPSGWLPAPPSTGGGGRISNFSFAGIDAGNWPVSGSNPYILTSVGIDHNNTTWEKISFYATAGATLHLKITAYTEASYDIGYICRLDSAQSTSSYLKAVSGDGVSEEVDVNIATTGNHYIIVGYVKDYSQSPPNDRVIVEVSDGSSSGTNVWMSSSQVTNGVSDGNWSSPVKVNGKDGADGAKGDKGDNGDSGPACPFIGEYDSTKEYFGTSVRTDVVHYNNRYYKAKASVGSSFVNKLPTNTTYWDDFGASFDSIATGFFFTEEAVIENAVVRKLRTNESGKRIVAENNVLSMFDETEQRLVISGEEMQGLPSSKSVSIQSLTAFSVVKSNVNLNTPQSNNGVSSGVTFTCEAGAVLTIPATNVYLTAALTGASGSGVGTMYCEASWQIDGTRIGTKISTNTNYPTTQTVNITLDALTITLGAGTHNIRLYASVVAGCAYTASQFNSNAYNVATTAQISYSHQKTEVAANGFRVVFGDSSYILQAVKSGSSQSSVEFLIRAGSYGIRVNDTGLKKTTNGGSTWTDI